MFFANSHSTLHTWTPMCPIGWTVESNSAHKILKYIMALLLDGNSPKDTHVCSEIGNLTCYIHLLHRHELPYNKYDVILRGVSFSQLVRFDLTKAFVKMQLSALCFLLISFPKGYVIFFSILKFIFHENTFQMLTIKRYVVSLSRFIKR